MKTKKIVTYSLVIAIILLMAFTPIGYFKTLGVEITFLTIPVVVGAILLGPAAGAIFGAVFGITSFAQCFGLSAFGAALMSINPVLDFILCLVPRILFGFLTGIIFKSLSENKTPKNIHYAIASISGAVIHTLLFVILFICLFGQSDYVQGLAAGKSMLMFMAAFVGINGIIEALACFIISSAVSRAVYPILKR